MTSTDDLDDARVLASLGRILSAGDPYTGLPLVDLDTDLFPDAITDAVRALPMAAAAAAQATADAAVPNTTEGREELAGSSELLATFVTLAAAAKNPDLLIAGAVTVDGADLVTSAAVVWPDGTPGTLTITARHATSAVTEYNITYGSPVTKTFTQPTITRNANGAATNVPQIVVT